MPYKDAQIQTRGKDDRTTEQVELLPSRVRQIPDRTSLQWLEWGLKSRTHEKPGWLRDKLLELGLLEASDEALWKRVISDYKCQLEAIEGMRLALGIRFVDPREHKGSQGDEGKFVSRKKESQAGVVCQRICGQFRSCYMPMK
jgi:hypothetical protein